MVLTVQKACGVDIPGTGGVYRYYRTFHRNGGYDSIVADVGTLFAVPFTTRIGRYLNNGENLLEIDVTNLPANRISDYDRRGVQWRIFNDINVVDVNYQQTLYDKWETVPSGLPGPVTVKEVLLTHDPSDSVVYLGNGFQP